MQSSLVDEDLIRSLSLEKMSFLLRTFCCFSVSSSHLKVMSMSCLMLICQKDEDTEVIQSISFWLEYALCQLFSVFESYIATCNQSMSISIRSTNIRVNIYLKSLFIRQLSNMAWLVS